MAAEVSFTVFPHLRWTMDRHVTLGLVWGLFLALFADHSAVHAADRPQPKVPILLDTDIGGDIDDALALGLVLTSPELELRGVTTVDGDAYTRALIVCRLLDVLERGKVPVASGAPPRNVPDSSGQMQYGLRPAHKRPVKESAVDFLAAQLKAAPGELTILCIGPLTNIAALLEKHPEAARQIKRLVIMGGSIRTGYNGRPPAAPEWNVVSDKKAAERVFAAGVPILLVPLDVTAKLKLRDDHLGFLLPVKTVLASHLRALYELWGEKVPILFDPTAVAVCVKESLCDFEDLCIAIDDAGMTRSVKGRSNAKVAATIREAELFDFVLSRLTRPVLTASDLSPDAKINVGEDGKFHVHGNTLDTEQLASLFTQGRKSGVSFKSVTCVVHPAAGHWWRPRFERATMAMTCQDSKKNRCPFERRSKGSCARKIPFLDAFMSSRTTRPILSAAGGWPARRKPRTCHPAAAGLVAQCCRTTSTTDRETSTPSTRL